MFFIVSPGDELVFPSDPLGWTGWTARIGFDLGGLKKLREPPLDDGPGHVP